MAILEQVSAELITATKAKDEVLVNALRMLRSAIKNEEIELRAQEKEITEADMLRVIARELKKRKEAAAEFEKAGRVEMAANEAREAEILQKYLPEQMTEEKVREIVKLVIAEIGAVGIADMGRTIKEVMQKVQGQAEGAVVSRIVKEELGA